MLNYYGLRYHAGSLRETFESIYTLEIMKLTLINFDMNFLGKRQSDNETSRRTYALVKLGPQEVVHELARLFPLVHGLVLEDEI